MNRTCKCGIDISHKKSDARFCSFICWERNNEVRKMYKRNWRRQNKEHIARYGQKWREGQRDQVFAHFGEACIECLSTQDLTLDHVNGDGAEHRQLLKSLGVKGRQTGAVWYSYLVDNQFDTNGYEVQVLCSDCHYKKSAKELRKHA